MSTKFNVGVPVKFPGGLNQDARDIITFWDDFLTASFGTADNCDWLETAITGGDAALMDGTNAAQETTGGWVYLRPEDTTQDGVNLTLNGEMFQIDQGYPLYFETRIYLPDVSDVALFVGLTESDLEIITGGIAGASIGFEIDASGNLYAVSGTGGSEDKADTAVDIPDGAIMKLAFFYDGDDTVTYYAAQCSVGTQGTIDEHFTNTVGTGELVLIETKKLSTAADYIPEDKMLTPTLEAVRAAGADDAAVDYVLVQQPRCQTNE